MESSKPTNEKVEDARSQLSAIDSDREQRLTRSLLFKLDTRYRQIDMAFLSVLTTGQDPPYAGSVVSVFLP